MPALTVFELRQYTLHQGKRDMLANLFHREFVTPQNAVGAHVLGTFYDLDDPDRFVWMRGFADMAARKSALEAFYGGPIWKAHREAANDTMLDSDNVFLLRAGLTAPVSADAFALKGPNHVLRIAIHPLGSVEADKFAAFFASAMVPMIQQCGATTRAVLTTETAPNSFPRLAVRDKERAFIWMTEFASEAAERKFSNRLLKTSGWRDGAGADVLPALMTKPEILRLTTV